MQIIPAIFEEREIRRLYDEKTETWFFSVVDIIKSPVFRSPPSSVSSIVNNFGSSFQLLS